MSSKSESVQQMMDAFMSDDGLDLGDIEPYHVKVNKKTGFFQIEEFSHNLSELIAPNLSLLSIGDMVLAQKNIYKERKTFDTFPKADTIPKQINTYYTKQDFELQPDSVELFHRAKEWLSTFSDKHVSLEIVSIPLRNDIERHVYHLNNKRYVFLPNPVGREIEKQASINNDKSFFTSRGFLEKHPINSQISAYELMAVDGKNVPSDIPATQINGMLHYYLEHEDSNTLTGASRPLRRTTLRRRKSRRTLHGLKR
jgi:hypothetical protein